MQNRFASRCGSYAANPVALANTNFSNVGLDGGEQASNVAEDDCVSMLDAFKKPPCRDHNRYSLPLDP
jgi:hypothetical protein